MATSVDGAVYCCPPPPLMMSRSPLTIRFALIALLLTSVVPMAVGLSVSAFLNSRETVTLMWRDLADELVEDATGKTLRFIEPGPAQLRLQRLMVNEGALDPHERGDLLASLLRCLRAQPTVTWCSWGGVDGAYLAAYRDAEGGFRLTHREQVEQGTRYLDYRVKSDGSLETVIDEIKSFDPRTRPWWKTGIQADEPTWAAPFLFASRGQPGVVLTLRQDDDDGELMGVWLAEYELSQVSSFLHSMTKSAHARGGPFASARIYVVSRDGRVIGHPEGTTKDSSQKKAALFAAAEHPDVQLSQSYRKVLESGGTHMRHRFRIGAPTTLFRLHPDDGYLGVSAPFPEDGPAWNTIVTVPAEALLGPVYAANRRATLIAALVAFVSVLLGVWLADRFVRPLSRIARDLESLGRLEVPANVDANGSMIREVSDMLDARRRMTGGLQSFAKYVPGKLVRQLMDQGREAALGGETRELTVYFSDIAGFTSIAEKLTPQELVDALGDYLGEMSDIVQDELGTVDKYIGDAIMAFWGAPVEVDNHALRACQAALRCQHRLAELRDTWQGAGLPLIHARIGLNSGDCLVGNIGSQHRMNYTVMGDPVNVASRLESQCKTYAVQILIGERTRELAGPTIVTRPIDKIAVKGKERGIVVHELRGLRDATDTAELTRCEDFASAFDAYLAGRFNDALLAFDALATAEPLDSPAVLLRDRCRAYVESPPSHWDGVIHLSTK